MPDTLDEYFKWETVTDYSWGFYVQPASVQPHPSSSRVVLKAPSLKKRANYARNLYSALQHTCFEIAKCISESAEATPERAASIQQTRSGEQTSSSGISRGTVASQSSQRIPRSAWPAMVVFSSDGTDRCANISPDRN